MPGVEVETTTSAYPSFRFVQSRLTDAPLERALSRALRARLPDVVLVSDYGGGTAWSLPWIVERLGARVVVATESARVLCHRGTLVHATEGACGDFLDPRRCRDCCSMSTPDGLGPIAAAAARRLRWLHGFSPFPNSVQFENRLDMVVHGLLNSDLVLVEDAIAVERLVAAGVGRRVLRVVPLAERTPEALLELFGSLVGQEAPPANAAGS